MRSSNKTSLGCLIRRSSGYSAIDGADPPAMDGALSRALNSTIGRFRPGTIGPFGHGVSHLRCMGVDRTSA